MADRTELHGSAVALGGRGCLIRGAPGAGKSALALELISRGAVLVADDRVAVRRAGERLILAPTSRTSGLIEARGVGIIDVGHAAEAELTVVVDLDRSSPDRVPDLRHQVLCGLKAPLLLGSDRAGLAAVLTVLLRGGRLIDPERGIDN